MTGSPSFHPPQQARSRETLRRLVEAARDILAAEGEPGLTVKAVVERAGSSVGSFYARFEGRDDLLAYLHREVWEEVGRRWEAAVASGSWDELDLPGAVRGIVGVLVDLEGESGEVRRALGSVGPEGGQESAPAERFRERLRRDMRELLLARAPAIGHPDPGMAVDLALVAVLGVLRELDRVGVPGPFPRDTLEGELVRLVLGYLGAGGFEGEAEGVEFFDVWV